MLTDSFYPEVGGSETAIWRLSEALVEAGHQVGIAVISKPKASNPSDAVSFWNVSAKVKGMDLKFFGKIHNIRQVIRSFKPDVINAHFLLESGYVGVKAGHTEGVPVVVSIRGKGIFYAANNWQESVLYPLWIRGACKADGFIATSQEMADIAEQRHGITVQAISNGVDTEHFRPGRNEVNIRERHGIAAGQKVIVCARRLVPKNGIEYMVRALPIVREQQDAVLLLAAPKMRDYERLKQMAADLGVGDFVQFLGPVLHDELPCYFAQADVVVQPSIAEARSLACLEAMASGAAVVATATGGLKELITHEKSGYLVPEFEESTYQVGEVLPENVQNLAEAVLTVLRDEELRTKLGQGARTYAETCSWPAIAEQSLSAYRKAIDSFSHS